jgi:hypothetical protein
MRTQLTTSEESVTLHAVRRLCAAADLIDTALRYLRVVGCIEEDTSRRLARASTETRAAAAVMLPERSP